jgi:hypothetical protein
MNQKPQPIGINPANPANDNAAPSKPELVHINIVHLAQLMSGSGAPPFMLPAFRKRRTIGRTYR